MCPDPTFDILMPFVQHPFDGLRFERSRETQGLARESVQSLVLKHVDIEAGEEGLWAFWSASYRIIRNPSASSARRCQTFQCAQERFLPELGAPGVLT